jgi:hypothetical protein
MQQGAVRNRIIAEELPFRGVPAASPPSRTP